MVKATKPLLFLEIDLRWGFCSQWFSVNDFMVSMVGGITSLAALQAACTPWVLVAGESLRSSPGYALLALQARNRARWMLKVIQSSKWHLTPSQKKHATCNMLT